MIPHLAVPFRIVGQAAAVVEQDTDADVHQNVRVILATKLDGRPVVPRFGISDPTFRYGVDPEEIRQAVALWEDRASLDILLDEPEPDGRIRAVVRIETILPEEG